MGIDVSLVRGHDVVVLTESGRVSYGPLKVESDDISATLKDANPDVVAIDSPPQWGTSGKSRLIETQLRKLGINIYSCQRIHETARFMRGWKRDSRCSTRPVPSALVGIAVAKSRVVRRSKYFLMQAA